MTDKIEVVPRRSLQYTREDLYNVFNKETADKLVPLSRAHHWTTGAIAAIHQFDLTETYDPNGDVLAEMNKFVDRLEADAEAILENDPDVEVKPDD